MTTDRRSFLASIGASAIAGAAAGCARQVAAAAPAPRTGAPGALRGLAPADDFLFDPGLSYLQTASLGPTPRPVIDRALAVWQQ